MRKQAGTALMVLGGLFFLNAVFGRYLVLPGYFASLEAGRAGVADAAPEVGAWPIARYLLWAYSFKLGVLCLITGAALRTTMGWRRVWIIAVAGFAYISFAYLPLPASPSIVFGVGGGIMTVLMVLIALNWCGSAGGCRRPRTPPATTAWPACSSSPWPRTRSAHSWVYARSRCNRRR